MTASADGGDTNLVHACVNSRSGKIRIVALEESCKRAETSLHWTGAGVGEGLGSGIIGRVVVVVGIGGTLTEAPVEGALVAVQGTNIMAITDSSGSYALESVPRGIFTLAATIPGTAIGHPQCPVKYGIFPNVLTTGDLAEVLVLPDLRLRTCVSEPAS
jgi:hypothetical protein